MRIVLLTKHDMFAPVLKGGELASRNNYEALCSVFGKENIEIISIDESTSVFGKYIEYLCKRDGYDKEEEERLVSLINEIKWDILWFDGSWFGGLLKRIVKKGRVFVFLHNVERQYSMERLKKNILTFIKFRSVSQNEKYIIDNSDYIVALNNRDELLIKDYYNRKVDLILPITIEDTYEKKESIEDEFSKKILFVGSYFGPNVQGIKWFINNVMPYVDCNLEIAGKGMEKIVDLESSHVKVLGTVDDLSEYYYEADAIIMPIFSGGGMKVKTAEALMYGKKILATQEALMGYDVKNVNEIIECNNAAEFIEELNCLDESNKKFYDSMRKKFLEEYTQEAKIRKLEEFIKKVV